MKNSNDPIGIRTHDLPTCSATPQPTASPRAPYNNYRSRIILAKCGIIISLGNYVILISKSFKTNAAPLCLQYRLRLHMLRH